MFFMKFPWFFNLLIVNAKSVFKRLQSDTNASTRIIFDNLLVVILSCPHSSNNKIFKP